MVVPGCCCSSGASIPKRFEPRKAEPAGEGHWDVPQSLSTSAAELYKLKPPIVPEVQQFCFSLQHTLPAEWLRAKLEELCRQLMSLRRPLQ